MRIKAESRATCGGGGGGDAVVLALRGSAYGSIWKLFRKMPTFGTLSLQREERRDAVTAGKKGR